MERKSEETRLLEESIDAAPTGFCNVSLEGRFFRVNPKFCEMLGYSREDLAQMTFTELTHPDDREGDIEAVPRMIIGELSTYHKEKRYKRKDGEFICID